MTRAERARLKKLLDAEKDRLQNLSDRLDRLDTKVKEKVQGFPEAG